MASVDDHGADASRPEGGSSGDAAGDGVDASVFDVDGRLCDLCLEHPSVVARPGGGQGVRVCHRCHDHLVEAAPIARGYGEWMRRRYERGELKYGPK